MWPGTTEREADEVTGGRGRRQKDRDWWTAHPKTNCRNEWRNLVVEMSGIPECSLKVAPSLSRQNRDSGDLWNSNCLDIFDLLYGSVDFGVIYQRLLA